MPVDVDVILKLFDTLRDSNKDLRLTVEKQTDAILAINTTVDNIKALVDQHVIDSGDAKECTEETERTVQEIWKKVKRMYKSVNTMIIIIFVAFTLMTISYFFVRSQVDTIIDKKLGVTHPTDDNHQELLEKIIELQKEIEKIKPTQ